MKIGHSFNGSSRKRFGGGGSWVIALLLVIVLLLSACSSSADNSNTASRENRISSESANSPSSGDADRLLSNKSESKSQISEDRSTEPVPPTREKKGGKRGYDSPDKDVQAGQLTAGEWDDIASWERFGNLLNSQEGDSSKQTWGFRNFHRLEVIVTSNGKVIPDAKVQLLDGSQEIWTARTNTEGRAYVFAGLFERDGQNQNTYKVQVQAGQESKTTEPIEIPQQGSMKVDLARGESLSNKVDVMFVVDTTGSMEDELNYLEAELKDVVKRVSSEHANKLDMRLSANFYRDTYDDYIVKPYPFITNIDTITEQFSEQEARGGGDYPEAVDKALRDAIHEHKWSEEARARLLFLVLDAPPHDDEQIKDEIQQLIKDAAEKGIRIIPVASSGVDIDTEYLLRFMSVATGGTYLFLTDDSGIGGDHLEPAVGEYEVKLLNDLLFEVINRYVQE